MEPFAPPLKHTRNDPGVERARTALLMRVSSAVLQLLCPVVTITTSYCWIVASDRSATVCTRVCGFSCDTSAAVASARVALDAMCFSVTQKLVPWSGAVQGVGSKRPTECTPASARFFAVSAPTPRHPAIITRRLMRRTIVSIPYVPICREYRSMNLRSISGMGEAAEPPLLCCCCCSDMGPGLELEGISEWRS
jgi:hypothetical protein